MGLLDFLIGKKKLETPKPSSLDLYIPQFTGIYNPELNATYVAVCDAHARHLSKIKPFVKRNGEASASKEYINRILGLRMNPKMSATQGWEILARDYFMSNNAIAWIEWDYSNYRAPLKAIWPLDPDKNSIQIVKGNKPGQIYLKFMLESEEKIVDYDEIILITRNAKPSTLLGQGSKAVDTVLKVIQTHYEGVEQAIRQSAFIRFIIQSTTPLTPEVKKQKAKDFADTYLGSDSASVAYIDGAQEITQVNSQAKYANADEVKTFKDDIFEYLSSNEKILRATYTGDEYQSYYESALEPFILKLMDELTYKLLTKGEIEKGNRIEVDVDRLQTASLKTRVMIADRYLKLPVMVPNVISELLFLPKTENGDKEYATLNYTDANKQSEYQGVDGKDDQENDPDETDPNNEEEDNKDA
jgi:hypothetical protein